MWPTSPQRETAILGVVLGVAAGAVALFASRGDAWPVIALATLPLAIRVRWATMPIWLLLVATAVPVMITESIVDRPTSATWLIGCVTLLVAAIDRRHRLDWAPIAFVVGGPLWLVAAGATDHEGTIVAIWSMGLLLSATGGTVLGQQRRVVAAMREAQSGLAAAAAAEERHRIAGEVHDLVGHSFSVVLLHLAGARHLMRTDPERAEAALRVAEDAGRQTMDELRASLALLRSGDARNAPVGGLSALPALVDGMRDAGLDVTFTAHGELDRVDPAVGVVVHGVAREALTNAAKHGAPGAVSCAVTVDDRVVLRVANPASTAAASPDALGVGLSGMHERVRAVGGRLSAGRAGTEWTVLLELPVRVTGGRA